jgi:transcriptional regulator with XRE-family HTH domain
MGHSRLEGMPDPEILRELGRRLRALRKARGLSAEQAAEGAGLGRRTVHRAEAGRNPTLATVVRLLRLYGEVGALERLVPEPELSPMALIEAQRKKRG